jgi:hypothetical protein
MSQRSFIATTRSPNEQDPHGKLAHFKVQQTGIESWVIKSKVVFKIFDEYANILKGMYRMRFKG